MSKSIFSISLKNRLDTNMIHDHTTGCFLWTGCIKEGRYGVMSYNNKLQYVHRLSYILHKGEIPDGMCVCHTCDVTYCINPYHLFLGTQQDNIQDKVNKNRQQRGEQVKNSKLTESDVIYIRKESELGVSRKSLARKFNVGHPTILKIVKRQRWKHI